jgi:glycogen(starch) synthase
MWNLTRAIPWIAEQLLPGRVVYYVADHWPYMPDTHTAYWREDVSNPVRRTLKRAAAVGPLWMVEQDRRRYALAFERVLCVSEAIRSALIVNTTIPPERLQVVYNGIDIGAFSFQVRDRTPEDQALRLLYAGSLVPHKGVQTAVDAMAVLARHEKLDGLSLTVVGSGRPDYEAQLRTTVAANGLDEHVTFAGRVPRSEMPAQLAAHDVLIFPSEWPEPLARMTQEAMAAGAVVIGTTTGGTGEILVDGETGLVFPPGDSVALANCVQRLRGQPDLYMRLARQARARVEAQFDFCRMLDQVEAVLDEVLAGRNRVLSPATVPGR